MNAPAQLELEPLLGTVSERYGGALFEFEEVHIVLPPVPTRRFRLGFPSREGEQRITLTLDVTFLDVDMPVIRVPLRGSKVYQPIAADDGVEIWTPTGFIADKLPALGFNTLGYARPALNLPDEGHSESIWKQLHDIGSLLDLPVQWDKLPGYYADGIAARNAAAGKEFTPLDCLGDALRVCRVASELSDYPDAPTDDEYYVGDTQRVRHGLAAFRNYQFSPRRAFEYELPARVGAVVSLLAEEIRAGEVLDLGPLLARIRALGSDPARRDKKDPLARALRDAPWGWPVTAPELFQRSPEAAISAAVAASPRANLDAIQAGHLAFET